MSYSFHINGQEFKTKKALVEFIKGILHRYKPGEFLNANDLAFMVKLLENHPGAKQKFGVGIATIGVRQNPTFKQREFFLVRKDGSKTDFSYQECLSPTDRLREFTNACRTAVADDIIEFKRNYWLDASLIVQCPVTGEILTPDNSHIDHTPPMSFKRLVHEFIKENSIDVYQVSIIGRGSDNVTQDTFMDFVLRQEFIEFHRQHAALRVISKFANLSAATATRYEVIE